MAGYISRWSKAVHWPTPLGALCSLCKQRHTIQLYANIVTIMLQEELPSKIRCDAPLYIYMTISVCLQRWIKLRCKGHAGLQARPFRSNIQQDEEVAAPPRLSGSHGLFQDSSLQLSWSRHMGVAIYSLKHTKPHETHKNSDCKTEKCHHGFSRSSVGKSWIFTNLH